MKKTRLFGTLGWFSFLTSAHDVYSSYSVSISPRDAAVLAAVPATIAASPPHSFVASAPAATTSLSPRRHDSLSPRFVASNHHEATVPAAPPTSITTAQDILSSVLHRPPPRPDLIRSLHMRQASMPQNTTLLFGSTPIGSTSIWSSNEGTGGNFHGAAGTTSGSGYQSYYSQNQQLPNSSSTFPPQNQASLGLGHPSMPLGQAYQFSSPLSTSRQRVQSLSTRPSQPYSSQSQSQSQSQHADHFSPYPALTEQAPIAYDTGVPGAFADPVYSRKLDPTHSRQQAPGMGLHDRTMSYHLDHRAPSYASAFPPPLSSMAQIWNNAG